MSYSAMEIPPLTFTYKTYRIDNKSPIFQFFVGKYAALSLRALSSDPESFGVAYSTEGSLTATDFATRLSRPNFNVFVCVAHPGTLPPSDQGIEHGAWVGMVTQIGATPKDEYWLRESGADEPLEDDLETKWHQTHTWIDPAHRGKGIAKQMVMAGVAYAKETLKGSVTQVRVRAFTAPNNSASKGLYGGLGFPIVGFMTLKEAMVGNGNSMYPFHGRKDWPAEIMEKRIGVVMEKVVKKEDVVVANGIDK